MSYKAFSTQILQEKSDLWRNIVGQLTEEGCFGPAMPLMCHNHPEYNKPVKTAKDFKEYPDGKIFYYTYFLAKVFMSYR